jgi:uncharacterized coiled-coil protein SlyX
MPSSRSQQRPRRNPPRPPSTRPPSSGDAVQHQSHEVFVQIASLKMAKTRQQRIRAALQDQVATATAEIERIDQKIDELYDKAGLSEAERPDDAGAARPADGDGFQYQY